MPNGTRSQNAAASAMAPSPAAVVRATPVETAPEAIGRSHLHGMLTVGVPVRDVVDQVDDAGQDAEDRQTLPAHTRWTVGSDQPLAEQQGQQDEEVLRPLRRPKRDEQMTANGPHRRLAKLPVCASVRSMMSGMVWRAIRSAQL